LDHPQYRTRVAASRQLAAAGLQAVEPLVDAVNTGNAEVADRAMKILEQLAVHDDKTVREATRRHLRVLAAKQPRAAEILRRFRSQTLDQLKEAGAHFQFSDDDVRAIYLDRVEDMRSIIPLVLEFPETQEISASTKKFGDAELEQLLPLKNLRWLNLFESNIGDMSLKLLREFPLLESVPMGHTAVTDQGLKNLGKLPRLNYLGLRGNKITDAGLAHLKDLPALEGLTLEETAVTGAGFVHLQKLPINMLRLMGSAVDDDALRALGEIKTLRRVDVQKTKATPAACQKLREAFPELTVIDDSMR
jgi:hypothetical protein